MATLRYRVLDAIRPDEQLARVGHLLDQWDGSPDPLLVISRLTGDGVALGAYQRRRRVVAAGYSAAVLRRATGGRACRYGAGQVALQLFIPDLFAYGGATGLDKVMNRGVRGLLRALNHLKLHARYGGRDFASVNGKQIALLSMQAGAGGLCLFEAVLGVETAAGVAPIGLPALAGGASLPYPEWTSLQDAGVSVSFEELSRVLLKGYSDITGYPLREAHDMSGSFATPADAPPAGSLAWSGLWAIPIGTLEAGVALDAFGRMERMRICGDFIADRGGMLALAAGLRGHAPDDALIHDGVEQTLANPDRHVMLGLRSQKTLAEVLISASKAAQQTAGSVASHDAGV